MNHAAAADNPPWGSPVVGIRLQGDVLLNIKNFPDQIVQKVGEPLDRAKISASLKNLFATGRFLELRADAEPKGNGVEVIFVCRVQFFVGVVTVEGAPPSFDPVSLANTARLRLGQPMENEDLDNASQHLAATLAEDGYYEAKITHVIVRQGESQETEAHFTIQPGAPAVLSKVEIQGHPVVPAQRLAIIARWHMGQRMTSAKLERGLLRIHQYYQKLGRLQAYTNVQGRTYDHAHHSETLQLQVEAGPIIKIRVVGAHLSTANMRQLLPMYNEGVTDDFAIQQGERNLVDYFERKGFFSAKAKGERKVMPNTGEIDLTFRVTPGPPGEFDGYAFKGNKLIDESDLIPLVTIQEKDFPFVWHGSFSHSQLDRDVAALKAYYLGEGFPQAKIDPELDQNYGNLPNHLFVVFKVEEGARLHVGRLTLEGVDLTMSRNIGSNLTTRSGQPYSPGRAQANQEAILSYLADHGYGRATASWKATPPSPAHDVDLEYAIQPGPQEMVQRVILMGNAHTREKIIRRFVPFKAGEPLRQSDIYESQRKLYDLGIFNQVQIGPQDPQSPETQKTVLVRVEESRRWTLGYGGGIEFQRLGSNQPQGQLKVSPRLLLDVSRLNVGGRAQTFTIRGQLSNLETSAGASYLIQHLPAREDLSLRFSGLYDKSRDVETFSAQRAESSVSLEKRYSSSTLLLARYTYRNVRVDVSTLHISPEEIPLLSLPARIGMLGATYINDHRDNPADATKGSYSLLDGGISVDRLGSQANFLRFTGQNSTYYPIGKHLTFARNTRLGVESPSGSLRRVVIPATATQPPEVVLTHEIPLPERFFMGGSESDRGFSINQAGPRDPLTGFPVGGNALFLNSLELRVRVEEDRLGFVLFHDMGNVYSSARLMRLLKVNQNSPTDLDYTSHAIGVGVRYRTPIGPLRFDVGYNLNPPRFQLQVPGGLGVSQLSHIQFFLGIGQTF
ncbi:MAG TPA: POTRA domain-containing protein [Terriglobia bacterium]|nr:POTRA domain-containing protein [Terriglobia bacterium]